MEGWGGGRGGGGRRRKGRIRRKALTTDYLFGFFLLPKLELVGIPVSVRYVRIWQSSVSDSVSLSAQDGIVALGKAHTRFAPPLSSLPQVAPVTVPMFVWLNTDRSRPRRVECWPLPFSTPLSSRRSVL